MVGIATPPDSLYTAEQLMDGFHADSVASILDTFSFKQFAAYAPLKRPGMQAGADLQAIALHDARVSELLLRLLYSAGTGAVRKVVGIMGGHSVARSSAEFADTAGLARRLASAGYMVVTGGGPGMMEAAHIGAYYSKVDDTAWDAVLAYLSSAKGKDWDRIPDNDLLTPEGKPTANMDTLVPLYFGWHKFGVDLKAKFPGNAGESLAISTWEYGQEPVSPFATHYACYFQNSIRESQLVREARAGIIYTRGGGGTLREIWQDVEENYYAKTREELTPMIFFDREGIWGEPGTHGTRPLDVFSTIVAVLHNKGPALKGFSWEDKIIATTNVKKILVLLEKHVEQATESFAQRFVA